MCRQAQGCSEVVVKVKTSKLGAMPGLEKKMAQRWLSEVRMRPISVGVSPWNVVPQGPYRVDIERC